MTFDFCRSDQWYCLIWSYNNNMDSER